MVPTNRDKVLPLEVPVAVDQQEAVAIELSPGDVSVHHPNIVHGSDANRSTSWRRGLTIRYLFRRRRGFSMLRCLQRFSSAPTRSSGSTSTDLYPPTTRNATWPSTTE
jgi:hypothetical protein